MYTSLCLFGLNAKIRHETEPFVNVHAGDYPFQFMKLQVYISPHICYTCGMGKILVWELMNYFYSEKTEKHIFIFALVGHTNPSLF